MASGKKLNHVVAFARQHRNTILPTFDAFTALARAQSLLEDVTYLSELYGTAGASRGRLSGLEITDYYAAGYVTCLEWHARSRRADLLNFMPELVQPSMMGSINMDAISQMMSAKVTLGDLIGASTKINNLKAYSDIFNEVWRALGIDEPLASILKNSAKLGGQDSSLHDLFERRHSLVHEIGIDQVGSYLLRDMWTFEEAIAHGRMVVDVISSIEKQISVFSSENFPNRLDGDGYPQDRQSLLQKQLAEIEGRVAPASDANGDFTDAKNSFAQYLGTQINFIDVALSEVPKRHYDPTPHIVEMLYRHRLEFLSAIAEELGV